ncbi:MAG: hypothetical protein EB107_07655 [Proteobacteria bacterium]|nr:hypothetical protein [Pseudomonadota bacterium]
MGNVHESGSGGKLIEFLVVRRRMICVGIVHGSNIARTRPCFWDGIAQRCVKSRYAAYVLWYTHPSIDFMIGQD